MSASAPAASHTSNPKTLILGALGVVFGDIGTSPLYTLRECLNGHHKLPLDTFHIFGILSLIFWAIMMVVSVKYVLVIMRADNKGEGGILALMALALHALRPGSRRSKITILLGIFGAALFYGDGMITPAISVLSAFEGISVVSHQLDPYILPLTILVIIGLFAIQSRGTAAVGKLFGPVMLCWFVILALLGLRSIVHHPEVLLALNPMYAVQFFIADPRIGFLTMGSIILAVTGGEALYADMGHFGRFPIRAAWFCVALPALVINYFGQGALLLADPATIKNPFFMLAPGWAVIPLVILAAAATVIASQAVISGAYSVTNQAIHLGYCPRMAIRHTSEHEIGQIYVPQINWFLLIIVILLVLSFKSSSNLASMYGLSVCGTMLIDTLLAFAVLGSVPSLRLRWCWRILLSLFFLVDVLFLSANAVKIVDGGWFPLLIGLVVFTLLTTWKRGRDLLAHKLREGEMPLQGFVESLAACPPQRVEGTAIFMTGSSDSLPHALLHNLKHNKVIHEHNVFLTVKTADEPFIPKEERVVVRRIADSFYQIIATYGFKEDPNVPAILAQVEKMEPELLFDNMQTSYFLSRETIVDSQRPPIGWIRRKLYYFMARNTARATSYFKIPPNRVVEMGMQIEF